MLARNCFSITTLTLRIEMKPASISDLIPREHEYLHQYFLKYTLLVLNKQQWSHYNDLEWKKARFRQNSNICNKNVKYCDQVRQIQNTWIIVAKEMSILENHNFIEMNLMKYVMLMNILNLLYHVSQLTYIEHFPSFVYKTTRLFISHIQLYLSTLPLIQKTASIEYTKQVTGKPQWKV